MRGPLGLSSVSTTKPSSENYASKKMLARVCGFGRIAQIPGHARKLLDEFHQYTVLCRPRRQLTEKVLPTYCPQP
jgi:hypothetical protein